MSKYIDESNINFNKDILNNSNIILFFKTLRVLIYLLIYFFSNKSAARKIRIPFYLCQYGEW